MSPHLIRLTIHLHSLGLVLLKEGHQWVRGSHLELGLRDVYLSKGLQQGISSLKRCRSRLYMLLQMILMPRLLSIHFKITIKN